MRPSAIICEEEVIAEVYSDALLDILYGEHECLQSSNVIIDLSGEASTSSHGNGVK
jgi:hypothetical protein